MAVRTSSQSGDWNLTTTWGGAAAPGDGDTVIITTGHTVTVTANVTVGVQVGTLASVDIQATDSVTYGELIVNDGVTLTLKGTDSYFYPAMRIRRYAKFSPQPGSRIEVDCTSDGQTYIRNEGRLEAIGTGAKPITFSVPAGNVNWNVSQGVKSLPSSATLWPYDQDLKIACVDIGHMCISNAAGTGIGSTGDTSIVLSSQSPATILQTEKAALSLVTAEGDYYVAYASGFIYFYHDAFPTTNPTFQIAYKYLSQLTANWRGWGINSGFITACELSYNTALFDYCVFEYMGRRSANPPALQVGGKQSAAKAGDANRLFYVKNSVFQWCGRGLIFATATNAGTAGDPLVIDNNVFQGCDTNLGDTSGSPFSVGQSDAVAHEYITVSNNTIKNRWFMFSGQLGDDVQHEGWVVSGNQMEGGVSFFIDFNPPTSSFPNSVWRDNVLDGTGNANIHCRGFLDIRGGATGRAVIQDNQIKHFQQAVVINRYTTLKRNLITYPYRVAVCGGSGYYGYAPDVTIENNVIFGNGSGGAITTYGPESAVAFYIPGVGYRNWVDNWVIANNTFANIGKGALSLGEMQGSSHAQMDFVTIATKCVFSNNIVIDGAYAVRRCTTTANRGFFGALAQFDHNILHGQTTAAYDNINRCASFLRGSTLHNLDAARNVKGVELWDPSYATNQAGRTLALTVTTPDSDVTLAWGSGDGVQLVAQASSTLSITSYSNGGWGANQRTWIFDEAQTWPNDSNNAATPLGKWVKITSGVASGETGAILSCVPRVSTTRSTYSFAATDNSINDSSSNFIVDGIWPHTAPIGAGPQVWIKVTGSSLNDGYYQVSSRAAGKLILTGGSVVDESEGASITVLQLAAAEAVPPFSTLPASGDSYVLYHSQATLYDSPGGTGDTVKAGIRIADLPTSTVSDTNISIEVDNTLTSDPTLVNEDGLVATAYQLQAGSPAINAGTATNAPAEDYWQTARPVGAADDIGFFEFGSPKRVLMLLG